MADIISIGGGRGGPQIPFPINSGTWPSGYGGGGGFGGGGGYGFGGPSFGRRRFSGAAPRPRTFPGERPDIGTGRGLPQIPAPFPGRYPGSRGPAELDELGITPDQWAQNRRKRDTSFDELGNVIAARERFNASMNRPSQLSGLPQGFGFGSADSDVLRRLLEARLGMGGGY